jgi:hypothetical protein
MNAILLALLFTQTPDSGEAKPAQPAGAHSLGEEVITGEAEVKIIDPKVWFPPQIDPFAPVNEILAPESYVLDEGLYHSVDSMTIPHHFIHSSYLRVPVERNFIYGDIMVFLPSFESRVATWELVVANSLGETVRRVRQKGQPPAIMTWDGKTDNGDAIATGEVYSFTFNAYDAQGNQTRIPGQPQRINGIVYQAKDEWVVAIAADQIFTTDGSVLLDQAGPRLDETANIVKEKFRKEVVAYVYSEQEKLSAERCRVVKAELARRVVLPPEALKVAPRFVPGLQPKQSRIEIHII